MADSDKKLKTKIKSIYFNLHFTKSIISMITISDMLAIVLFITVLSASTANNSYSGKITT